MKKSTKLLSLAMAGCMAFSLAGCGSSTSSGSASASTETSSQAAEAGSDTITLGVIGPMTGSVAVYGTHISKGVELAVEEINAAGGLDVGGTTYSIVTETKDDQCDPTECLNAMNSLIADGVQIVVGSATSGCTSAITSVANSEHVVMITPSGTSDSLTTTMDYVFRSCFADSFQGKLAAKYCLDNGYTSVGIVYCSADTYSSGLRDAFTAAAEEFGLTIVAEESVATMTEVDYTNQFTKMVSAGAQAVLTPFYYDVMGPYVVNQARQVGYTGVILGCDGVDNTEGYIPEGADLSAFNDVYFTNLYAPELSTSEVSDSFLAAYEAKYGEEPNNFDAMAYDAVYILAQAMTECGSTAADDIQAYMADTSVTYDRVGGNYCFDETGTPIKDGVLMGYSYSDGDAAVTKSAYQVLSLG